MRLQAIRGEPEPILTTALSVNWQTPILLLEKTVKHLTHKVYKKDSPLVQPKAVKKLGHM